MDYNTKSKSSDSSAKMKPTKHRKIDKFHLSIVKEQLVTKGGYIKKKSKDNLKMFDDILKSELLIVNKGNKRRKKQKEMPTKVGANNNNYQDLEFVSNNNKSDKDNKESDKPRKTTRRSKTKDEENKQARKSAKTKDSCKRSSTSNQKDDMPNISSIDNNKDNPIKSPKKTKTNKSIEDPALDDNDEINEGSSPIINDIYTDDVFIFQCDTCKKTFKTKSRLCDHICNEHLNNRPFACNYCPKRFKQFCNLQVHLVKKHYELTQFPEKFICDLCNNSFLIKENLSLHLSNHTKGVGFYKCAFCVKKFSNHYYLTEHEKHHLKNSIYKCAICKHRFSRRSKLITHVREHLNVKDFVCQYCGRGFLRPGSIKRHVEVCHSGFRIQCPICCKKLKGHLTEHLRTHEKSRPHKCPDCGQRFTQSTQLTVHRRSHTGAKPYLCRICDQKFTHSNAMLLHFRRHTGEKPFPCPMCPFSFVQLPHMKAHMMKIHGRTMTYKCTKCKQFFKFKKHLDNHVKLCKTDSKELTIEEKMELSIKAPEMDSFMNLSRMRFLLALLLTMVASKSKLKCLGAYFVNIIITPYYNAHKIYNVH